MAAKLRRWAKPIFSRIALFGWAFALIKPILWLVGVMGDVDFIAANIKEIGDFFETGWGTLTTVGLGALIIGSAVIRASRESPSVSSDQVEVVQDITVRPFQMVPNAVHGCSALKAFGMAETGAIYPYRAFDSAVWQYAQWEIDVPREWDEKQLKFRVRWSHAIGTRAAKVAFIRLIRFFGQTGVPQ